MTSNTSEVEAVARAIENDRSQRHYGIPGDWDGLPEYQKSESLHAARAARAAMQSRPDVEGQLANIEGEQVVIRVPISGLPHAASVAWDEQYGDHNLFVENLDEFAKEFVRYLNAEEEDGTTVLHRAFDKAVIEATEQGGFGIGDRKDAEQALSPRLSSGG